MNRRLFARGSGVVVDVCRGHGTWFDAGELPATVEFVMNGGLARAEAADLAEQRERARAERQRATAAAMPDSPGLSLGTTSSRRTSRGGALVDLLLSLW
ncbi:MAG: zf-TFIIB domain-containing protein [Kofleriaceae bacterium]